MMRHHDHSRRVRLRIEGLEDRRTPSAVGLVRDVLAAPPSGADSPGILNHDGSDLTPFGPGAQGLRVVWGESTIVDGAPAATWAVVSPRDGTILAAGVTFSLKLANEMPAEDGPGPANAFASLDFPAEVQDTTFLNHLEMQSNLHGHEAGPGNVNPDRNRVPHFDFHFYGIPEAQVWTIPDVRPPLPAVPPERLPEGYTQPGRSVLEMGRHSVPTWSLSDPNYLSTIMLLGYLPDGSQMHFVEPMVSQETLLARQDFTLPVPLPQSLGRAAPTLYPTRFNAVFQGNSWTFVLSHFVTVPGGESGLQVAAAEVPAATPPAGVVNISAEGLGGTAGGSFGLEAAVEQFRATVPPNSDVATSQVGRSHRRSADAQQSRVHSDAPPVHVSPVFKNLASGIPSADDESKL